MVMNLSAMRETWVQSLGWEDPLEKGMTTHSCILAWRIPWSGLPFHPPGDLPDQGSKRCLWSLLQWLVDFFFFTTAAGKPSVSAGLVLRTGIPAPLLTSFVIQTSHNSFCFIWLF